MRRLAAAVALVLLLLAAPLGTAHAATPAPQNKGLLITPLRQFTSLNAGDHHNDSFTVANLTDHTIAVIFSIKQFSVADYTYDYRFNNPNNNWLTLGLTEVSLKAGESHKIPYAIAIPANSAPGGHYYTLFASAKLSNGGFQGTVQAATLLYLTVNGKLVKTGRLQSSSVQRVAFGRQISYTLEPINTGNVYYFVYVSGALHGLFTKNVSAPTTHLLMPGKVRRLTGSIPSPVLPGVYRATFGYKTDAGTSVIQSRYVMFIPPWFIALVLLLVLFGNKLRRAKQKKSRKTTPKAEG